jgi:regulator of PEP synthase PpsR (kinase-PPPase family)
MPVLDPIIRGLSSYIGMPSKNIPGLQHELDREYFHRIDAIDFALSFDDGQNLEGIEESDVILVGVSRTSKTPTCVYLARRGIRAANIPLVPGRGLPEHVLNLQGPLFVGLTESPDRLIELRNSRLRADSKDQRMLFNNDYLDPEKVGEEVRQARRFFAQQKWPVIDVTRKSVEETSAEIMFLLQRRKTAKEDDQ